MTGLICSSPAQDNTAREERQAWLDAEYITQEIFHRRNAPSSTIEQVQQCLLAIQSGRHLKPIRKGNHVR